MAKHLRCILLCLTVASTVHGLGLDFQNDLSDDSDLQQGAQDFQERLLLVVGNNGLNLTQLAALAALAAAALLPLLGLCALGLLLWALLSQQQKDTGYGSTGYGHGGGGGHSSYSSSYKRSYDSVEPDWESLSIMDWLAIAEDAYKNFDPSDAECQKKVVCELHQNTDEFGPAAHTITQYFSYLQYAEVLSIPEDLKAFSEDLLDAADRGRSLKKDCADIFPGCTFSLKKVMDKYGHSSGASANAV